MATKVIMPQLGESVVEGTVSRWLKAVGDRVEEFEPLLEVSTDKVDSEIPAPAAGVVLAIYVQEGTTVERGALLALIGEAGEPVPETPGSATASQTATHTPQNGAPQNGATPGPVIATAPASASGAQAASQAEPGGPSGPRYSPVVMRMAAEFNLDLSRIPGTGLGGRVTKKDVEAFLSGQGQAAPVQTAAPQAAELAPWEQPGSGDLFKPTDEIFRQANAQRDGASQPAAPPPAPAASVPAAPASGPGDGELTPHSRLRRIIAERMVESKLRTAPHVTTVFEVDMARVMAHWKANEEPFKKQGIRLTLTAYFVMAVVRAAQAQPVLNSRWTDDGLFTPRAVNVGMAVALSEGLIVPVIRNAQDLSLAGVARQVGDLAARARNRALKADETTGGTITLTNHGVSGSLFATPVINQPESAIVGVGAVQKRVVALDESDSIAIRPMLYATLTFDHRVADGAIGDAFMQVFKRTLEEWV